MDLMTFNEGLLIGGLVVIGLVLAVVWDASRRRKKQRDRE
jgi:hypothetical protein